MTHAAIGGLDSYRLVCQMMRQASCDGACLMNITAQGGNTAVLTVVVGGIKVCTYRLGFVGLLITEEVPEFRSQIRGA